MSAQPSTREWSSEELAALDRSPLIRVAGLLAGGAPSRFVTIGHVRVGRDELVRSLNGQGGSWYRIAVRAGRGEIEVGERRIAVVFLRDEGREAEVDRALRMRYGNDAGVRQMTMPSAREATLRIVPLA